VPERYFKQVALDEIPLNRDGSARLDLFVHLPTANNYVMYIANGDDSAPARLENLRKQTRVPVALYILSAEPPPPPAPVAAAEEAEEAGEAPQASPSEPSSPEIKVIPGDVPAPLAGEFLDGASREKLTYLYRELGSLQEPDAGVMIKKIESMADEILNAAAPEVKDLREYMLKGMNNLAASDDTSAITSLAILFALGNGFDSKTSHKDLAYAVLLMDLGLTDFSQEQIEMFYATPEKLPREVLREIKFHPSKSHLLAQEKLKGVSEVTLQLILNHHELFNGKGYPRGVRSDSLFPLVRVLALAVDVFEILRRHRLLGTATTIPEILTGLLEESVEAHLRRHSRKAVTMTLAMFNPPAAN